MSTVRANNILDSSGGNTAQINGMTPTAQSLQGFRNRIINGDMRIDQRNNGASVTPATGAYTLDRWITYVGAASKLSIQRSTVAPAGFTNSALITSLSAYTVGASETFLFGQKIEGFNFADLGWGAAGAQTVTLSFWVRSSLTGTFGGSLGNGSDNRWYPFSYTISAANTWEQKTITVSGDTTGTWNTGNGTGLNVYFSVGTGSTLSGTAGSWGGTTYFSATGATSVVGTNGATFYITGVQLEAGSVATPFERRDYGRELMMCQRYYQLGIACQAVAQSSTSINGRISLFQQMRATPSLGKTSGNFNFGDMVSLGYQTSAAPAIAGYDYSSTGVAFSLASFPASLVSYRSYRHEPVGGDNAVFTMSAEL